MDRRKLLLEKLDRLDAIDEDHLPVVTIDDYFLGNTDEESIAPNQWGEGRPCIAEIYACLKAIEAREDVQGVFVGLHQCWGEAYDDDRLWPAAENIHIYSSAPQEVADEWIVGLKSNGVVAEWPYGKHAAAPEPQEGQRVYTVYWD